MLALYFALLMPLFSDVLAGKTTALAEVAERLRIRGFGVFVVPEVATIVFTGGATITDATERQTLNFQTQVLRSQFALEDAFVNLAHTSNHRQNFILCDRGACDGRAYMAPHLWTRMLDENNFDMVNIRDGRYDVVVHLVTAADGAPEFYSLESNKTRSETAEEAVAIDRLTQTAWVGHPHLRIVDNRTGFRDKINRVDAHISELAGIHLTRRVVRKFLVHSSSSAVSYDEGVEQFNVEQTFLRTGLGDDVQESVRRRGKSGVFTYVHKVRRGDSSETKRQITGREFTSLLAHSDEERGTVRIRRQCFLHEGSYFVLDNVVNVIQDVVLLRCHCEDGQDERMKLPEWIHVDKEVTNDRKYSMHTLSMEVVQENLEESV